MKAEVKQELKEKGRINIFTEARYKQMVELMKYGMSKDHMLKSYLSISPDFKVSYIVDHMIKFTDLGKI